MNNLLPGLRKFSEEVFPRKKQLFEALYQGQKPHTLIITCSDSRIDPSLVTQTQPGEIFVLRNAGNIVPPYGASKGGEEATIEFAIDGLGVSNIVLCGHSQCGAMAGLVGQANLDALPSVRQWLSHATATQKRLAGKEANLVTVAEENVLVQSDNLKTHPSVSAALREKRVRIFGWVYQFETGSIRIYDRETGGFRSSQEVRNEMMDEANRFAL